MDPQYGNAEETHYEGKAVASVNGIPASDDNVNGITDGPKLNVTELVGFDAEIGQELEQYFDTQDYTTPKAGRHIGPINYQVRSLPPTGQEAWSNDRSQISMTYKGCQPRYPDAIRAFKETIKEYKSPDGTLHMPEKMQRRDMDYTPIFRCHARLYVVGTQNNIVNLRQLALHRLCRTLRIWVDWYEVVPDLVDLFRLTCSMTEPGDEMREILLDFVALKFSEYQYHPVFREFLESNGKFCMELLMTVYEEMKNAIGILGEYRDDSHEALLPDKEDDDDDDTNAK